ncbi:MAG: patatin-like phospholipase family protein [Janthinobacterium lividum]
MPLRSASAASGSVLAAVRRRLQHRRRSPAPVVGLVLSGGGASASFQVGALRYLYDVVGIAPTVITGTSAGSILAALLAQADDHEGQRRVLDEVERRYEHLRTPADIMVELDWFAEVQKLVPALQRLGQNRASHLDPQPPAAPTASGRSGPSMRSEPLPSGRHRPRRREPSPARGTLAVLWNVTRSRPDFEALLRGARQEQSLYRRGPIFDELLGPDLLDEGRLARSGTELRVAVVALESGELRYVTGRGVLVDRADQPVGGEGPVSLVDAVHASCAIPAVYAPVALGAEHYVDGGTRENLPVAIATRLGVTRCYAVNALPTGVPTDTSYADKDLLAIVLRTTAGIMSDEVQLDDLTRAQAAGAVLIAPEVDVLGVLEVDPGLLAIAKDYGYVRAAEACEDASPSDQRTTRHLIELRRRIWTEENDRAVVAPDSPAGSRTELATLKWQLRDLLALVPPNRLPPGAELWWQGWEGHVVEIDEPVAWVVDAPYG